MLNNDYKLQSSLLKFALVGGVDKYKKICESLIKEHLNAGGNLIKKYARDWQSSSEPYSLGRHLYTDMCIHAMGLNRTEEDGDMENAKQEFKPVIDALKKSFSTDYQDSLLELKDIVKQTHQFIKASGKDSVLLYRRLSNYEGSRVSWQIDNKKIYMDVNILSSYTPRNNLHGYTGVDWSDVGVKRYIPIEQVIIHPNYLSIADFEFSEKEAIVYNPNQRVVLSHPDNAFKI